MSVGGRPPVFSLLFVMEVMESTIMSEEREKKGGGVPGEVSLDQPGECNGTIEIPHHAEVAWAVSTALPTPPFAFRQMNGALYK